MRRRVLVAIVAGAAAAVLAFGLPLGIAVERLYRDEEVIRLERLAAEAGLQIGATVGGADPVELPSRSDGTRIALFAPSGDRVTGEGPARADPAVVGALAGSVTAVTSGGELAVAVPVSRDEHLVGVIRAAREESVVSSRVRNARLALLGLAALALAIAVAIGLWLSRRLARPVERLAADVERLGAGEFSVRAAPTGMAEIDAASEALARTAGHLAGVLERERSFAADASHQLRTPLAALRLDLEATTMTGKDPAAVHVAERALTQVERLEETIETLLGLARDAPAGSGGTINVAELLGELEGDWRGLLAAHGRPLRIELDTAVRGSEVTAGPARETLRVLLANASAHGSGPVTVSARALGGAIAFDVRDAGQLAIDPSSLFARRDQAAAGTGIGLSLARSLAEAEGGRLAYDASAPSTTFTLLLPDAGADSSR